MASPPLGADREPDAGRSVVERDARWTVQGRRPLVLGFVALAYFVTGWLGLRTPQIGEHITLLWPPTGIALFVFVRFGPSSWPAITAAAFAVNLVVGTAALPALGISIGNTLGPWVAAWLLMNRPPPHPHDGVLGSIRFIFFAAVSMLIPATIGTASLFAGGLLEGSVLASAFAGWWAGDTVGMVVVGSLLLAFRPSTSLALRTSAGLGRFVIASAVVAASSAAAFYSEGSLPFVFVTLMALAIISVLEPRFNSAFALVTAGIVAVFATTEGMGPFARDSIHSAMPIALSYVAAMTVLQIFLHAAVRDHRALGESEMRNRRLLEAAPDAMLLVSGAGLILDANERACRAFGQTWGDIVGSPACEIDLAATQQQVVDLVRRVTREGPITFETEHVDPAGFPFPVEVHVSPYRLGTADCIIAAARDIRRRKEEERRRRENETRLQAIFSHEPECVKTLDRQCRLLDMNPAGLGLIAAESIDAVRGLDVRALLAPEYHEAFAEGVDAVFEGKTTFQIFEIIALDGTRRWMEQHAAPLPSADDPSIIEEMIAVTRDISDRKEAERKLLQKQRVEALGSLAGGIAHDLNNTLSPVLLSVDELYERLGPGDPMVARVERSAERAVDTIRHLLSFARGSEGESEEIDPFEVLRELEKIVDATFPKSIAFEIETPERLRTARADATQLHHVLVNLCVNARDAMPRGGTLRVSSRNVDVGPEGISDGAGQVVEGPGSYLMFVVEDTGEGISTESQLEIFEPFYSTKPADEGTGLGLSSASGTIASHAGAILVDSQPGQGARFSVYLPALDREVEAPARPEAPTGPVTERRQWGPRTAASASLRGRALLVDDEASVRAVAEHALGRLGFEVHCASNAAEALTVFERIQPIEILVTDLRMPGVNGIELIERLRAHSPWLPVVLTSGHMDEHRDLTPERPEGVVRLDKPYRIRALQAALERALSNADSHGAPSSGPGPGPSAPPA